MQLLRIVGLLLLISPGLLAADLPRLTVEKKELPDSLSKEIRAVLDPKAVSIADTGLTLWFRSEFSSGASADQIANGLTYRELSEGTLMGVVRFEKPFVDFRKQEIAAGVYTLRLGVQPDIGDHKDTAPHADFCLLVPVQNDTKPDTIEMKELIPLSRKSTAADHPAVMLLFPHYGKEEEPKLISKPAGVTVLQLRRAVTAGNTSTTIGVGIVVAGSSATRK